MFAYISNYTLLTYMIKYMWVYELKKKKNYRCYYKIYMMGVFLPKPESDPSWLVINAVKSPKMRERRGAVDLIGFIS